MIQQNFILAFLLTINTYAVHAQQDAATSPKPVSIEARVKKTAEQKAAFLTDKLNEVVSLSPDQYTKAQAVTLKFVKAKEAAEDKTDVQAIKDEVKAAAKIRKTEMSTILTPEQVVKWKAWKEAKKGENKKNGSKNNYDDTGDMEGM